MRYYKEDRSILKFILLSFVTLGVYNFWVLHQLNKDVNDFCKEDGVQSPGILILILFSLLTCGLYSFFWYYRLADMLQRHAKKNGIETDLNSSFVLICFVLGAFMAGIASWVGLHTIFKATNEIAAYYNNKNRILQES